MSKYWRVINIAIQNTLVYRANFFFRSLIGLIPLTATIMLWQSVYESRSDNGAIAGYTLARMISYYLVVMVVDSLTAVTDDDWQIAADIKDGNISQFLLKPIDYLAYRLCLFGAGRLVFTGIALVPMVLFIAWHHEYVYWPTHHATWVLFGLSLIMTALLQFFISYTLALLAFWLLEISTIIFIVYAFEYVVGGHLFPLDILPPALASALNWTPFAYELFFPSSIFLEQVTGGALWRGLCMQLFWVLASYTLARWIWKQGVKHYEAVGG